MFLSMMCMYIEMFCICRLKRSMVDYGILFGGMHPKRRQTQCSIAEKKGNVPV